MSDVAKRAEFARWNWKVKKARDALFATFEMHGRQLRGEWCDYAESHRLSTEVASIGSSPGRVIQRWVVKERLGEILRSCDLSELREERLVASVLDGPDAAWIAIPLEVFQFELIPSAVEWMTDGFVLFASDRASLLSVDVEEVAGASRIETTVIGEGIEPIGAHLLAHGPEPLPILN
ncbi:hypothetical protein N8J89_23195 [Crossiella sp. CA-258035]|uniref:hypothetical protein n=1 Tax=Crossiella sp. CA-258035 TaxID=2981138 RepID=UPI0024BC6DD7|nr:hypothetical protein [Crossiella sp. CA-258035]WHT16037.1 hypothetical protein N8J89_23195 [Crossiella sp. CA-258035]